MELTARLSKFKSKNDKNAFAICEIISDDYGKLINATRSTSTFFRVNFKISKLGSKGIPQLAGKYKLIGDFNTSNKQPVFEITDWDLLNNKSVEKTQIINYLSSSTFKGVGKKTAEKLYETHGSDIVKIIAESPESLKSEINEKQFTSIQEQTAFSTAINDLIKNYPDFAFDDAYKAVSELGNKAKEKLRTNPFHLFKVKKIGFKKADQLALLLGGAKDDPLRIQEVLHQMLLASSTTGNIFEFQDVLLEKAAKYLETSIDKILPEIKAMQEENRLVINDDAIYLPCFYESEHKIAKRIVQIMTQGKLDSSVTVEQLRALEKQENINLSPQQEKAILDVFLNYLSIITGGPGTGKSTVVKFIIKLYKETTGKYPLLLAPTGKAARRMNEICGIPAFTIHSALGLTPTGEIENSIIEINPMPLKTEFVIIDEFSMVDQELAAQLFIKIKHGMRILLLGDSDQLPSVGPGNVLFELLKVNSMPITYLKEIYRQAHGNKIITNSFKIKYGKTNLEYDKYMRFINTENMDCDRIENGLEKLYKKATDAFGYENVLLLLPYKKSGLCSNGLNLRLQELANNSAAAGRVFMHNGITYKIGDRIIQTKNMKINGVIVNNGETGSITGIQSNKGSWEATIKFDSGISINYSKSDMDNIDLGYALTIHKSQGSEAKVVIVVMDSSHKMMAQRNLLYTAVTRAKEYCFIVGTKECVDLAISKNDAKQRNTFLNELINQELTSKGIAAAQPTNLFLAG